MTDFKAKANTITSLMTTELNSLANNAAALGVEFDNAAGLWLSAIFELNVTFGTNPTAGNTVDLYIIPAPDGTNYDDAVTGASGSAPSSCFAGGFPVRAVTTAQHIPLGVGQTGPIPLPPTKFKAFLRNGAGQAFPSSGSTLKMVASMYQSA